MRSRIQNGKDQGARHMAGIFKAEIMQGKKTWNQGKIQQYRNRQSGKIKVKLVVLMKGDNETPGENSLVISGLGTKNTVENRK